MAKRRQKITPRALLEIKMPGDVQVAPDGIRVAFGVSETDWDDNSITQHLYVVRVGDDAEARQVTRGTDSEGTPRWSPDGKWLAFLCSRDDPDAAFDEDEEPKQQVWLLPMDGHGGHRQDAQGRVLLGGSLRDTSVQKRYQENADLFNSRKNATLEILSHDLSGAFILVQQIAEFLREEVTSPLASRVPEMLGVLETTSRNSVKMIREELINLEFLTSANTDLKVDRVDVGAVLRVPLDQLQNGQRVLGHAFIYTLPAEPIYANLDVNKFTQVLINLVANALKFTPHDGHVTVHIEPGPGVVRIRVVDNGIGIPLAMQPHLFERFTKARRPGLRGEATTGLGLALCKTIVEWHHGHISVASQEGQGSTFTIEIPQAETVVTPVPTVPANAALVLG